MIQRAAYFTLLILLSVAPTIWAQDGGQSIYQFLANPTNAKVAGNGGTVPSSLQARIDLLWQNPALLRSQQNHQLSINYGNYFSDVSSSSFAFAHATSKGTFAIHAQHFGYGDFIGADQYGVKTGNFTAKDNAVGVSWSYPILDSTLHIGVTLQGIFSAYEQYSSNGIATSFGVTYDAPNKLFSAGVVLRNLGTQISSYADEKNSKLPYELNAGVSKRLSHAPFAFHLALKKLLNWPLDYEGQERNLAQNQSKEYKIANDLFKHLNVGFEFVPSKNFYVSASYNYQQRSEMELESGTGLAGFSWGLGFQIKSFSVSFANDYYHKAGNTTYFSLTTDFDRIFK